MESSEEWSVLLCLCGLGLVPGVAGAGSREPATESSATYSATHECILLSLTPGRQQCHRAHHRPQGTRHSPGSQWSQTQKHTPMSSSACAVNGDRARRLPAHVPLAQVDALVLARANDLDVGALAFTIPAVRRHDDGRAGMRCIPYARRLVVVIRRYVELDCECRLGEADKKGGKEKREGGCSPANRTAGLQASVPIL